VGRCGPRLGTGWGTVSIPAVPAGVGPGWAGGAWRCGKVPKVAKGRRECSVCMARCWGTCEWQVQVYRKSQGCGRQRSMAGVCNRWAGRGKGQGYPRWHTQVVCVWVMAGVAVNGSVCACVGAGRTQQECMGMCKVCKGRTRHGYCSIHPAAEGMNKGKGVRVVVMAKGVKVAT